MTSNSFKKKIHNDDTKKRYLNDGTKKFPQ